MQFQRSSGVLLHITSLPSYGGIGDLGPAAYEFLNFLKAARQHVWQVLPLCPTGYGNSPYAGSSAFAANPFLISLEYLSDWGWIDGKRIAGLAGRSGYVDFMTDIEHAQTSAALRGRRDYGLSTAPRTCDEKARRSVGASFSSSAASKKSGFHRLRALRRAATPALTLVTGPNGPSRCIAAISSPSTKFAADNPALSRRNEVLSTCHFTAQRQWDRLRAEAATGSGITHPRRRGDLRHGSRTRSRRSMHPEIFRTR